MVSSYSMRRTSLAVVALVLTLGLAVFMAVNAERTAREHRKSAEGMLHDYASLAADQFAERLNVRLATQLYPILALLATRGGALTSGPLPSRERLTPLDGDLQQATLAMTRQLFRIDAAAGLLSTTGAPLSVIEQRTLRDSVVSRAAQLENDSYFGFARVGSSPHLLAVFAVRRDSAETIRVLYGFTLPDSALVPPIHGALRATPLLPPSLLHGVAADSAAGVQVLAGPGSTLFERHFDRTSPYIGARTLSRSTGLLDVRVSLTGILAPQLVVGGLPPSRTPALLALLAVAALLVAVALLQLRRERAFAALREDFVSGVSHEIRTPLAQIRLFSETLRLGRVRSERERDRSLEIIDQEARRLAHLVDNLLHFSRAERGAVSISRERTNLERLVLDVADHFRPMARSRGVSVETSLDPTLEAEIDPNAFRQILLNLLDNALKYGPDGQVIAVSGNRDRADIVLSVSDQGPGVPLDARERIWDRFWREDRARNSSVVGTGIGLAIVRELVTLHGGRALVTDAPGGGARFEIRLSA